jgi:hypothetical protein
MTQLDRLRAALKYSSGSDRQAIRAMILEIECGFTNAPGAFAQPSAEAMQTGLPCRVRSPASAGSDPGGQVPDVAPAPLSPAGDDPNVVGNVTGQLIADPRDLPPLRPCARCNRSIVGKGKEAAKYCLECSNALSRERRTKRTRNAGGAERTRACALQGCPSRIPSSSQKKYCSEVCIEEARQRRLASGEVIEPRQAPPGPPRFLLAWNSAIVIRPDRPAPHDKLYWDDLNARADHGSPSPLPHPDSAWRSPTISALAGAI